VKVRAKATHLVAPTYPWELRAKGIEGTALVSFVVSAKGMILEAKVVSATDSLFGDQALKAVAQWKFEPATVAGIAVSSEVRVPLEFKASSQGEPVIITSYVDVGGTYRFETVARIYGDFDQVPIMRLKANAVYPKELKREKITGTATVTLLEYPDGRARVLIATGTRPEFVDAARVAALKVRFRPGVKDGAQVGFRIEMVYTFPGAAVSG
jgi:protein TonB